MFQKPPAFHYCDTCVALFPYAGMSAKRAEGFVRAKFSSCDSFDINVYPHFDLECWYEGYSMGSVKGSLLMEFRHDSVVYSTWTSLDSSSLGRNGGLTHSESWHGFTFDEALENRISKKDFQRVFTLLTAELGPNDQDSSKNGKWYFPHSVLLTYDGKSIGVYSRIGTTIPFPGESATKSLH